MTSTVSDALLAEHPAFRDLSPARLEQLAVQFQLRRFAVGQPLCHRSLVPGEVLLILEGEARLLVEEQGRPATLAKLGPGEEAVYKIRVRGRRAGHQRVQVRLVSDDQPTPITKEEVTSVYDDR